MLSPNKPTSNLGCSANSTKNVVGTVIEPIPHENLLNGEIRDVSHIDGDVDKTINKTPDNECRCFAKEILTKTK